MSTAQERQAWLDDATAIMRDHFLASAAPAIPATVRVSWGFPSIRATSTTKKRIGECFSPEATKDAHNEIFLHPCLGNDANAPLEIAAVLAHELVHAAVGCKCGHKGKFRTAALAIGLEGKMTATRPGDQFKAAMAERLNALGPFPTSGLDPSADPNKKKQSTRMLKCICLTCGYNCRTARKHIDASGPPLCPCNRQPMDCNLPDDETETENND